MSFRLFVFRLTFCCSIISPFEPKMKKKKNEKRIDLENTQNVLSKNRKVIKYCRFDKISEKCENRKVWLTPMAFFVVCWVCVCACVVHSYCEFDCVLQHYGWNTHRTIILLTCLQLSQNPCISYTIHSNEDAVTNQFKYVIFFSLVRWSIRRQQKCFPLNFQINTFKFHTSAIFDYTAASRMHLIRCDVISSLSSMYLYFRFVFLSFSLDLKKAPGRIFLFRSKFICNICI